MKWIQAGCGFALFLAAGVCLAAAPIANLNTDGDAGAVSVNSQSAVTDTPDSTQTQQAAPVSIDSSLTLDQRVAQVENQMQYLISQQNQAKSMGAYITNLQGQIEQLNFQVGQMQKQLSFVQQAVVQLEARVKLDDTKNNPVSTPTNTVPVGKQEMTSFQNAYNLLVQHQYSQAIQAFNNFMTRFPKSSMAPDAHYWLGELYLVQGQPDQASQHFQQVISNPNSDKAPDAMLKLGMIYQAYGDSAHAKQMFQKVVKQYPNTPSAQAAQAQLGSMQ